MFRLIGSSARLRSLSVICLVVCTTCDKSESDAHLVEIGDNTYSDDRAKSVWRSEFIECRYQRSNNSVVPAICVTDDHLYCCYKNALLDNQHLCCSFSQFLDDHWIWLQVAHICVWANSLLMVVIIAIAVYLIKHSNYIIEEDRLDNLDLMKSWHPDQEN